LEHRKAFELFQTHPNPSKSTSFGLFPNFPQALSCYFLLPFFDTVRRFDAARCGSSCDPRQGNVEMYAPKSENKESLELGQTKASLKYAEDG